METFNEIMDYEFTANMETQLDLIANNKLGWVKSLDTFCKMFLLINFINIITSAIDKGALKLTINHLAKS